MTTRARDPVTVGAVILSEPRHRLILADAVAGLLLTYAYLLFATFDESDGGSFFTGPPWLGWLIAACVGLPLAVRRIWPIPALTVVVGGSIAAMLLDIAREPFSAIALALYTVGLLESARRSAWALSLTLTAVGIGLYLSEAVITPAESALAALMMIALIWLLATGGWGLGITVRRKQIEAARAAANDRQRVLAEERMRIARELHDIVSHNLSLIAVQAGVANHVAGQQPEQAQEALRSIEGTSRNALTEMRGLLGVLRSDGSPGTGVREPTPGLHEIPQLVESAQAAGVTVQLDLKVQGSPSMGMELTLYRIVQESLTNVVKHAAPTHCDVKLHIGRLRATVEVSNAANRRPGAEGGGHGLIGIRERVMMYGGEFRAGPRADGGFTVAATLPYEEK